MKLVTRLSCIGAGVCISYQSEIGANLTMEISYSNIIQMIEQMKSKVVIVTAVVSD